MFSRYGFPVLFVFLVICMQKTVTDAAAIDEACTADGDCLPAGTLACDLVSTDHKCRITFNGRCASPNADKCATNLTCEHDLCKIKAGISCSGHESNCVDGATCSGSNKICTCHSWRQPAANGNCAAGPQLGALGGTCRASAVCDGNYVCEDNTCKIKHGDDCTAHDDICVNGATCPATGTKACACDSGRLPAAPNGTCTASSTQVTTTVGVGEACTAGKTCDTTAGLVCESNICKYKNGTECSSNDQKCVDGATCIGTPKVCVCGTGRTPATSEGKCAASSTQVTTTVGVGEACTAGKTCDTTAGLVCESDYCKYKNGTECSSNDQKCVDGATCIGTPKVCVCGTGRTPATSEGKCAAKNGAPSLLASLLFVVGLLMTSRLL